MNDLKNIIFVVIAVVTGIIGMAMLLKSLIGDINNILQGTNLIFLIISAVLIGVSAGCLNQVKFGM